MRIKRLKQIFYAKELAHFGLFPVNCLTLQQRSQIEPFRSTNEKSVLNILFFYNQVNYLKSLKSYLKN